MKFLPNGVSVVVLWLVRISWLVVGLLAPWADVAESRSRAVSTVMNGWGWVLWGAVLLALLVPSTASLTVVRAVTPLVLVAGFWSGRTAEVVASGVALGALWTSETADGLVQGSAYGAETRFCLRSPLVHEAAVVPVWAVFCGCLLGGSLLVAAGHVLTGAGFLVIGLLLSRTVPRRLHRLSRRWLVLVPAGIVVHDHLVLAETVMVRRSNVSGIDTTTAGGDEADLTGGTFGRRLRFVLTGAEKVILTPIARRVLRTSEVLHVQSFVVNPLRRQQALGLLLQGK
ncbi:MAG: hypothetical protein ACKOQ7_01415 [Actinomycetota bacterium]